MLIHERTIALVIIVLSVLVFVCSFYVPARYRLNFTLPMDVANRGVGVAEFGGTGPFRWFAPQSTIELPVLSHALRIAC